MNPLDALDDDEKQLLAAAAKKLGITLDEAMAQREQVAGEVDASVDRYMNDYAGSLGISRSELNATIAKDAEAEARMIGFMQSMGCNVRGRWQIALITHERQEFCAAQANRGKSGATKRWSSTEIQNEVAGIIRGLSKMRDSLGDFMPPADLWPHLWSRLDEAGLKPDDQGDHYAYAGNQKIAKDAFRKQVQRLRSAK